MKIFNKFPNLSLLDITNCDNLSKRVVDDMYKVRHKIIVADTINRDIPYSLRARHSAGQNISF